MHRTTEVEVCSFLIQVLGRQEEKEGRSRRGWQRMSWWDGITTSTDMNLSKLREMVEDRETWHAAIHGVRKRQTWQSNWTTIIQVCCPTPCRLWVRKWHWRDRNYSGKTIDFYQLKLTEISIPVWKTSRSSNGKSLTVKKQKSRSFQILDCQVLDWQVMHVQKTPQSEHQKRKAETREKNTFET